MANRHRSGLGAPTATDGDVVAEQPVAFLDDPAMTDAGEDAPLWTRAVPVSINDAYGDPLIPEQIDNTVVKLAALTSHRAPVAVFTKAGYDEDVLTRLATVAGNPRAVIFYSLTGLEEGGVGFPERLRVIEALHDLFPNTFVFTRPIIPKRNDDPATLRRLAEAASQLTGQLVLGGVHDAQRRKRLEVSVEDLLIAYCDALGVRSFLKTSCAAAWVHGQRCWVHDLRTPRNVNVLRSLGYTIKSDNVKIYLDEGSTGDINFIRMVSGADVYVGRLLSNYNLLTIPAGKRKLETHSSWFPWSENIETCLDCNYCIIKQIEYLKKMRVRIGVHPTRIPQVVIGKGYGETFQTMRLTRLPDADECHEYEDVRAAQACRAGLYPRPRAHLGRAGETRVAL